MDEDRLLKVNKSCDVAAGVIDLSTADSEEENYIKGGILSNSKISWVSCGPRITTINNNDGSKHTGWTFGWEFGDPTYKIVCVEELPSSPILLVACDSETSGGSLCFYHSGSSTVLKAVHFREKITSLGVVSESNNPEENLSLLLKPWSGVVAVGTGTGKVYLLDIWWNGLEKCIEEFTQRLYDEKKPSKILVLAIQDLTNNVECRTSSVRNGSSTLALWLNEETLQQRRSASHPGVQNILGRMPREFLTVSAIKYFPQISTLAVGYNTSCFQLWDLTNLTILYTSALLEAMLPVFSFSLLEPSDDPRFVCYLWSLHHSVDEDNTPFAGMYILSYHQKHLNSFNAQPWYEGFSSCSIRYQLDLGTEIDNALSGRIVSCQSINRNLKHSPSWMHTEHEEGGPDEMTPNLLAIAWEVWTPSQLSVFRKLTLFDLNQWYREYMPQSSDTEYSRFMIHLSLPDGPLLDVKVAQNSVRLLTTLQPVDEHFYPSATSFECVCLQQSQVLSCAHVGVQEECLQALLEGGPSALLLPSRLYKMFIHAGIRPLLVDVGSPNSLHNKEQREYLLSIALEYRLTQYLRNCVRDWSDGSHAVAGCTLPSLLHWAWGRVQRYKKWLDRLCVPLFDYSGIALDTKDLGIFHHMVCQLHSLHVLFKLVLDKYSNCIIPGNFEQQHVAINLVTAFYDAVLWCVRHKVLPETNAGDADFDDHIPYFTDKIVNITISRRAELHHLAKSLKHEVPTSGLLMIDAVIAQEADGNKLTDQWEREGGSVTVGKYPPPSVQSLLRVYLIRGVPVHIKHFIVGYFLYDIVNVISPCSLNESTKQNLFMYPSAFKLTESQSKIIRAFWCLDHKQFEEGVEQLLDSSVKEDDLQVYQHRTVISLLMAVGKHKLALHYLNIRWPGLTQPQDVRMRMTLLLVNNLIHEAYRFLRHHSSPPELLDQFFTGCVEMNKLDIVFKLPLSNAEEEAFMTFLEKTSHPKADDLRVFYLLSRSRYVEAIDMNEKLRGHLATSQLPLGHSPLGPRGRNLFGSRDEATIRDLLVNSVAKSMPSVTRELTEYCSKQKPIAWKQVKRPTPLSTVIHTDFSNEGLPFYKTSGSHLVQAALSKTRETWAPLLATPASLKRKRHSSVQETPFLRTPILPRINTSVSNPSRSNEAQSGVRWKTNDDRDTKTAKKAKLELSTATEDEFTSRTLYKTTEMELTCPESSALLHTPHVQRAVKQQSRETNTPHSILKAQSAASTPATPAASEQSLPSRVNRQIRFSLPQENSSTSSSSVDEEEDQISPTVTPRKSIHETSSVKGRKSTPANPRILRHSFWNAVSQLQFDDEETAKVEDVHTEPSATAATLLKKISTSPISSEDTYFSFQSSSSSKAKSGESGSSFRLSSGLEGNILNPFENEFNISQQGYLTLIENEEMDASDDAGKPPKTKTLFDILKKEQLKTKVTPKKSVVSNIEISKGGLPTPATKQVLENSIKTSNELVNSVDESFGPKSPDEVKIVIECSGTTSFAKKSILVDYDMTGESFSETESTLEKDSISLVDSNESNSQNIELGSKKAFKWIEDPNATANEILQLEVNKQDSEGKERCIAKVTMSEKIPMYFSEPQPIKESSIYDKSQQRDSDVEMSAATDEKQFTDPNALDRKDVETDLSEKDVVIELSEQPEHVHQRAVEEESSISKSKDDQIVSIEEIVQESLSENTTAFETPLPQLLDEILKRGRISLSVKQKETCSPVFCEDKIHVENETDVTYSVMTRENKFADINADLKLTSSKQLTDENPSVSSKQPSDEMLDTSKDNKKINDSPVTFEQNSVTFKEISREENNQTETVSVEILHTPQTVADADSVCVTLEKEKVKLVQDPLLVDGNGRESNSVTDKLRRDEDVEVVSTVDHSDQNKCFASLKSSKLSTVTTEDFIESNLPKEQNETFTFVIESAGCLSDLAFAKGFEGVDLAADFELKMSEDDSAMEDAVCSTVEEVNVVKETEGMEEPIFETLKTVPIEFETKLEEGNLEEEIVDELSKEENLNEVDEDIYGDLDEEGEQSSPYKEESYSEGDESEVEDKCSDIICLGSSSDEDPPQSTEKLPTLHKQRTPKMEKRPQLPNETLDYEDDSNGDEYEESSKDIEEEEEEVTSDSSDENHFDDDSENEEILDSSIEKPQYSDLSESEEDIRHGNRSWKEQRKVSNIQEDSDEDADLMEEENTIESPPYELIGQNSQSNDDISSEHDKKLGIISETCEEVSDRSELLGQLKSIPSSGQESSPLHEFEVSNALIDTDKDSDCFPKETAENNDEFKTKEMDMVKPAENKRKECVETGSILDLKNRRSKRYSSASDLNVKQSRKLRRRSCSLHDFTSALIMENKQAGSKQSAEDVDPTVNTLPETPSSACSETKSNLETCLETDFDVTSEQNIFLQAEPKFTLPAMGTKGFDNKASSIFAEFRGVASLQETLGSQISTAENPLNMPRRRSKSIRTRSSSLQDISEDIRETVSNFQNTTQSNPTAKRSISKNQLSGHEDFDKNSRRRSTSASSLSEYVKAHESEINVEIGHNKTNLNYMSPLLETFSETGLYSPIQSMKVLNPTDSEKLKNTETSLCVEESHNSVNLPSISPSAVNRFEKESSLEQDEIVNMNEYHEISRLEGKRKQRAKSEPFSSKMLDTPTRNLRRRSSLNKIDKLHNKLFLRHSLRRSSREINFLPLEIVNSDEDSFREPVAPKMNEACVAMKSIPIESETDPHRMSESNAKEEPEKQKDDENMSLGESVDSIEPCSNSSPPLSNTRRNQRGSSEPPSFENVHIPKVSSRRRSSSFAKLEKLHKIVFKKYLPRKSTHQSNFQPLEIVQSDEEMSQNSTFDAEVQSKISTVSKAVKNITSVEERDLEKPITLNVLSKGRKKKQKIYNFSKKTTDITTSDVSLVNCETSHGSIANEEDDIEELVTPHIVKKKADTKCKNTKKVKGNEEKSQPFAMKSSHPIENVQKSTTTEEENNSERETFHPDKKRRGKKSKEQTPMEEKLSQEEANPRPSEPSFTGVDTHRNISTEQVNDVEKVVTSHIVKKKGGRQPKKVDQSKSKTITSKLGHLKKNINTNNDTEESDVEKVVSSVVETYVGNKEHPEENNKKENRNTVLTTHEYSLPPKKRGKTPKMYEEVQQVATSKDFESKPIRGTILEQDVVPGTSNTEEDVVEPSNEKHGVVSHVQVSKKAISNKRKKRATEENTDFGHASNTHEESQSKKRAKKEISGAVPKLSKNIKKTTEKTTPNKLKKTKKQFKQEEENFNVEQLNKKSLDTSIIDSENEKEKRKVFETNLSLLGSPARRTRSASRLSDTELLTPTADRSLAKRKTTRSTAMSDIVSTPLKHGYAESEASDLSASSKPNTPTRRSTRRQSFSTTPNTPDLKAEEYLSQRRLTRNQHSQLQKSFELSLLESPRISRLEDVPEESGENEASSVTLTPVRSSSRNSCTTPLTKQTKTKKSKK